MKRLKAEREKIEHVRYYGEARTTWKEAVVNWSAASLGSVKPKTRERYQCSLRAVAGTMGDLHLDEINRRTIAKIAGRPGVSNATRRRDLTAVSAVLRHAVSTGLLEQNVAAEWDRSGVKESRLPRSLPDEPDIAAVVAEAPGLFANLIRFAQYTGMRQEEVAALTRRQIDRERQAVQLTMTKANRPRSVPLDERAWGTLEGTPAFIGKPYVFWHHEGARFANVSSRFALFVGRAENKARAANRPFHAFRFHDLRHWYAVDYLRRGGGIYRLQQILGHSSVKVTEMYLDYLTPEEAQRAKETV